MGSKEGYSTFNTSHEDFMSMAQARTFLKEKYGKCKRSKMYIDSKNGESVHVGYIYGFINRDISHDTKPWYQQDWVSIYEVSRQVII